MEGGQVLWCGALGAARLLSVRTSKSLGTPHPSKTAQGEKPEHLLYLGRRRLVEENAICIRHNPICVRRTRVHARVCAWCVRVCVAASERAYPHGGAEESLGGISTPHFITSLFT